MTPRRAAILVAAIVAALILASQALPETPPGFFNHPDVTCWKGWR